jgi:hypothetical protein
MTNRDYYWNTMALMVGSSKMGGHSFAALQHLLIKNYMEDVQGMYISKTIDEWEKNFKLWLDSERR